MAQPSLSTTLPTRPRRKPSLSGGPTAKSRQFIRGASQSPGGYSKSTSRRKHQMNESFSQTTGRSAELPFMPLPHLNRTHSHSHPSTTHPILPDHAHGDTNFNKRTFSTSHNETSSSNPARKRPMYAWQFTPSNLSHLPAPVPGSSRQVVADLRESYRKQMSTDSRFDGDINYITDQEQEREDERPYLVNRGSVGNVQILWSQRTRASAAGMITSDGWAAKSEKGKSKERAHSNNMNDDPSTPTSPRMQIRRKGVKRRRFAYTEREPEPWTLCPSHEAKAMMPPEIAEQYELAGLDYHEPLPSGIFPHGDIEHAPFVGWQRSVLSKADVNAELNQLKPPPKGTDTDSEVNRVMNPAKTPQRQALHTLTTIVDRMISEGQYQRAGRAFGLLLRTRLGQKAMDLPSTFEWGRGVEILLHHNNPVPPRAKLRDLPKKPRMTYIDKDPEGNKSQSETFYPDSDDEDRRRIEAKETRHKADSFESEAKERPATTEESWAEAMEFFEYLIMQFPHTSTAGDSGSWQINAFGFYHQMYESWILHIEDVRKSEEISAHGRFNLPRNEDDQAGEHDESRPSESRAETAIIIADDDKRGHWLAINPNNGRLLSAVADTVQATYERARAVAEHMDGVLASLPYSNDHDLVALRAKVERWLAELSVPLSARTQAGFRSNSNDEMWNEDLVWAPNHIDYNREGRAVRQSPANDSSSDSDQDNRHGLGDTGDVTSEQRRELQHAKKTRSSHIRKAKRLMGSAIFLRRSAHLRMNGWGGQAIEGNKSDNKAGGNDGRRL